MDFLNWILNAMDMVRNGVEWIKDVEWWFVCSQIKIMIKHFTIIILPSVSTPHVITK